MPSPSSATAIKAPTTILSTHDSSVTSGSVASEEGEQDDEVEAAVEDDRGETPTVRERTARDPARAEQVADSSRAARC